MFSPIVAAAMRKVAFKLAKAPWRQMRRGGADESPAEFVSPHTGIAKLKSFRGTDYERRVADDQVETFFGRERFKEAARSTTRIVDSI
jgi:hypothetical protein